MSLAFFTEHVLLLTSNKKLLIALYSHPLNKRVTDTAAKMLMLFFHLTLRKTFYNLDNGGLIEYVIGSLTHFVLLLMHSLLKLVVVSTKINRLALHLVIDLTYLLVYGLRIPHPNYHFLCRHMAFRSKNDKAGFPSFTTCS